MEPEGSLPYSHARQLSLSWANSTQSPRPPPTSSTSILILVKIVVSCSYCALFVPPNLLHTH
jgi:hypothetical protein